MASLQQAVVASESAGRASSEVALDEVEIQKGLLQVARGLEFLHTAGMVHGNLDGHSVCINAKGDWKLCGFGFLTPLKQPDGTPTPFRHPDYDPSLPPSMSVNFDYLAPEYALDEKREPANDMYSLGCIVYAVHSRGDPPFRNRNSLSNLRNNVDRLATMQGSSEWSRLGRDVLDLLSSLLTRFSGGRLTAQTFQSAAYFNSILVSTLKFLERESFSGRSKDERVQFLKGLLGVLPQFSDRLLRRKVLPALLELMSDRSLLPFILPNVFHIARTLSSIEFTSSVLPRLQPLFAVQDPPQNQLMLLDQIELFVSKTSPPVFREGVTPLLYSALEAEQIQVQERALQQVPRLCEVLEFSHVKEVLFPRIAVLFSKTKILSVKVNTLIAFHQMVSLLDKHTLSTKLVPLLARIKTREPSVMVATLAVHEALASKVDREVLATEIIPQLWVMSMGPLLGAEQFERFMGVAREMGEKVAKEHSEHLREARRMQEHTEAYDRTRIGGGGGDLMNSGGAGHASGEVDFATLVGSGKDSGAGVARDVTGAKPAASSSASALPFDPFAFDDLNTNASTSNSRAATPVLTPSHTGSSFRPTPATAGTSRPSLSTSTTNGTRSSSFTSPFPAPPASSSSIPASSMLRPGMPSSSSSSSSLRTSTTAAAAKPAPTPPPGWSGSTLMPTSSAGGSSMGSSAPMGSSAGGSTGSGPNYNISLSPASGFGSASTSVGNGSADSSSGAMSNFSGLPPLVPQTSSLGALSASGSGGGGAGGGGWKPSGGQSGVLQPTKKSGTAGSMAGAKQGFAGSEFDPFA